MRATPATRSLRIPCFLLLLGVAAGAAAAQSLMGYVHTGSEDYGYYNNAVFVPDGSRGLIADPNTARVIVFDPRRYADNIEAVVNLPGGAETGGIYLTPDGSHACVLQFDPNLQQTSLSRVVIIRLADFNTIVYTPPVGTLFHMHCNIAFTPDSQYGLVCNNLLNANQLHIFKVRTDLNPGSLHQSTLLVGTGPVRTYVSPDGARAFVLCTGEALSDKITVVRTSNLSVETTFTLPDSHFDTYGSDGICVNNIAFTPDGLWGFIGDPWYNDILAFNIPNYGTQPYYDIPENNSDSSISRVAVSPDGARVLVSSIATNNVYVFPINYTSSALQFGAPGTIHDSAGFADWDGYNNIEVLDNNTAFIGSVGSDEIVQLNYRFASIASFHDTADSPEQVTLTPDGRFLAVACVSPGNEVDLFATNPMAINVPFLRSSTTEFTGYGISNPTPEPATVIAFATDRDGDPLAGTNNPAIAVLDPYQQISFIGEQFFGLSAGAQFGWIQILSNSDWTRSFFLNSATSSEYMDGTAADEWRYADFHIPSVAEDYLQGVSTVQTELFFVNPNPVSVTLQLRLRDAAGNVTGTLDQAIAPGAMLSGTLRDLFFRDATIVDIASGYLTGSSTTLFGVAGFALTRYFDPTGAVRTIRSLPLVFPEGVATLYCPHIASGGEAPGFAVPYDTVFHLVNTHVEAAHVTLTLYNDAGAVVQTAAADIASRGQLTAHAWELFGLGDPATRPPYTTGNVVITSDKIGLIGDVVFGDGLDAPPQLASSMPLEQFAYHAAVFSHVANGPVGDGALTYYNGLAVANPNDSAIQVTVRVFRQNGTQTGLATVDLAPKARLLRLLNDPLLVPDSWGQLGGYVTLDSTQPFLAFELFTDNSGKLLSAVPKN
jgi:DNA-binding beta-propeller fold protein YncE